MVDVLCVHVFGHLVGNVFFRNVFGGEEKDTRQGHVEDMSPTHEYDFVLKAQHLTVLASCRDMSPSFRSCIALWDLLLAMQQPQKPVRIIIFAAAGQILERKRPEMLAHHSNAILEVI